MEPTLALPLLVALIALALAFDFLNGLHDAANSIATVVSTRLLSPLNAVIFAAFFNFAAYFLSVAYPGLHKVAETIGKCGKTGSETRARFVKNQRCTDGSDLGDCFGARFGFRGHETDKQKTIGRQPSKR